MFEATFTCHKYYINSDRRTEYIYIHTHTLELWMKIFKNLSILLFPIDWGFKS